MSHGIKNELAPKILNKEGMLETYMYKDWEKEGRSPHYIAAGKQEQLKATILYLHIIYLWLTVWWCGQG